MAHMNFKMDRTDEKPTTPPTSDLHASIRVAAKQARARYNPEKDPVLQDFKRKMKQIRISS
ncbi:hypothetical protein [Desulfitobacterium sp.]|uniref:hypothetical protein n=1 Tax=Desulfitobacterium sp. TaxID=49981 RepID=UPI002CFA8A3A|nr:hypothetical protein [Desulfitobacterium sp.]HVJ50758.1 hypothetical protein [Desulfitobacterium sp.]